MRERSGQRCSHAMQGHKVEGHFLRSGEHEQQQRIPERRGHATSIQGRGTGAHFLGPRQDQQLVVGRRGPATEGERLEFYGLSQVQYEQVMAERRSRAAAAEGARMEGFFLARGEHEYRVAELDGRDVRSEEIEVYSLSSSQYEELMAERRRHAAEGARMQGYSLWQGEYEQRMAQQRMAEHHGHDFTSEEIEAHVLAPGQYKQLMGDRVPERPGYYVRPGEREQLMGERRGHGPDLGTVREFESWVRSHSRYRG